MKYFIYWRLLRFREVNVVFILFQLNKFRISVYVFEQNMFFVKVSNLLYDICILQNLEEWILSKG